jgi:hypothetical protein
MARRMTHYEPSLFTASTTAEKKRGREGGMPGLDCEEQGRKKNSSSRRAS